MSVRLLRHRFTVDEYHRMADAGILTEDDRVELIQGEIVEMVPIGSRHAACVNRLAQSLAREAAGDTIVSVQNPVRLGEDSEPQPDVALLRPRPDFYAGGLPGPTDVLLVVEVAETSADSDREIKIPLYARAGVPEVWLVDLRAATVEVYRNPSPQGYRAAVRHRRGEPLSVEALPDLRVLVDEVLA
ncbi:MAG: Uma2 family endonuclease [Armatimonadetes bacterium]|nr:Uma2 family endonuclease [Armatimonadota bacterium]